MILAMETSGGFKANDELKWVSVEENSLSNKLRSKGIFGLFVPLGCIVTSGILATGIYQLLKKDSRKQQLLMRYRILAQGITVLLATVGVFQNRIS